MSIDKRSPIDGPSERLNEAFQEWWYVLNGIGLVSFELLLESSGNVANGYFYALLSTLIVGWMLYISKGLFPTIVKRLRASSDPDRRALAREVAKDYLGVVVMPVAYLPYFMGTLSLVVYTLYPVTQGEWSLYLPAVLR